MVNINYEISVFTVTLIITKIVRTKEKGRGVVADRPFFNGQFICEYAGELLMDIKEARRREKEYPEEKGSFMFFFQYDGKKMWLVCLHNADQILSVLTYFQY